MFMRAQLLRVASAKRRLSLATAETANLHNRERYCAPRAGKDGSGLGRLADSEA